jgi:hypothetical protein
MFGTSQFKIEKKSKYIWLNAYKLKWNIFNVFVERK